MMLKPMGRVLNASTVSVFSTKEDPRRPTWDQHACVCILKFAICNSRLYSEEAGSCKPAPSACSPLGRRLGLAAPPGTNMHSSLIWSSFEILSLNRFVRVTGTIVQS